MPTPRTDDGSPEKAGVRAEARVFLVVAAGVLLWFVVYWLLSYERAGMTLLLLTAVMTAVLGGYFLLQARRHPDPAAAAGGSPADGVYLPHASVWPFAIGIGAVLVGNGIALGLWAVFPGAALLAYGIWGFARQSRRRD